MTWQKNLFRSFLCRSEDQFHPSIHLSLACFNHWMQPAEDVMMRRRMKRRKRSYGWVEEASVSGEMEKEERALTPDRTAASSITLFDPWWDQYLITDWDHFNQMDFYYYAAFFNQPCRLFFYFLFVCGHVLLLFWKGNGQEMVGPENRL